MKARGASVVAVATDDDEKIESVADFVLRVPATEPMFTPMVDVISLQTLRLCRGPWTRSKRGSTAQSGQDRDGRIVPTVGVGIDVVDVPRFEIVLGRRPRIVDRLFTEGEQRDARGKAERLAARFAAKEAVMKSLSVGAGSVPWKSIEVKRAPSGAPSVMLHGAAAELAVLRGAEEFHISLTHTAMTAAAFVVASSKDSRAG